MEAFYGDWMRRLEQILRDLTSASRGEGEIGELIDLALSHYKSYYLERRRLAERDVLQAFAAPWMTSFERTFLWIGGGRPSLAFRLLDAAGGSGDQAAAVMELRVEAAAEEERLSREMASLQEAMATPVVVAVVRRAAELSDGAYPPEQDAVVGSVLRSLRLLLDRADVLRVAVAKGLVRILSPEKVVKLLVASTHLQIRIRAWGTMRQA
ncbi:protein DOG1-like 4 [Wolffia australiana]